MGIPTDQKQQSRLLSVKAPLSGSVIDLQVAPGTFLNDATAAIMTIANLDTIWVTANVPEKDIAFVFPGQSVKVTFRSYPDDVFEGKVLFVSDVVESDTRRNKVRIAFDNPDKILKPNMFANATFSAPPVSQLIVPTSALLMTNDRTSVFVEVSDWAFERRNVEADRRHRHQPIIAIERNLLLHRQQEVPQAAMGDRHAFRGSGGARGVDDVGGVVRLKPERRGGGGVLRNRAPVAIEADDAGARRGKPIDQRGLRHQHARPGVGQHEAKPLRRVGRVERQIGAPRLENPDKPDHHSGRALDAQPHHHLGPNPEPAQMMRQPVGAPVELAIRQALLFEHHRHRVRRARCLRRQQRRHARRPDRMPGVVPPLEDRLPLPGRQNVQAPERTLRLRNRRRQKTKEPAPQRLNARPIKQVGRVFDHPGDPGRRAVRPALLAQAHRQVELGAGGGNRFKPPPQPRQIEPHRRLRLERQHHLEQRMPRQRPRRVDNLNQPLKRKLLVAVGRQIGRPHPPNQLPHARIARRVGAQHQRVDEEPDQIVQRRVGAPRYRAPQRDVAPSP